MEDGKGGRAGLDVPDESSSRIRYAYCTWRVKFG